MRKEIDCDCGLFLKKMQKTERARGARSEERGERSRYQVCMYMYESPSFFYSVVFIDIFLLLNLIVILKTFFFNYS